MAGGADHRAGLGTGEAGRHGGIDAHHAAVAAVPRPGRLGAGHPQRAASLHPARPGAHRL